MFGRWASMRLLAITFGLALLSSVAWTPPAFSQQEDTNPAEDQAAPETGEAGQEDSHARPNKSALPAEIIRDLSLLPFPARRMHELLVEAARSGDIEKLRQYIGSGDDMTMLSLGGLEGDPIDFLKSQSGDAEGREILAILLEVLESGFVHLDAGTENEVYVWPYFFAVPLDVLTPQQKVELFTILTSGDLEEMKSFGAYVFYRVGITPQGRWRFFVAGD